MFDFITQFVNANRLNTLLGRLWTAIEQYLLVVQTWAQVASVVVAFLLARLISRRIEQKLRMRFVERESDPRLQRFITAIEPLVLPIVWLFLQWLSLSLAVEEQWSHRILRLMVSLLAAWVVIRLTSIAVRDPLWARVVAIVAWSVAALNILGFLDDAMALLSGVAMTIGGIRVSLLTVFKAAASLAVLLWLASRLGGLVEQRVQKMPRLTPSLQFLIVKLFKLSLVTLAVVVALSGVGIDLTAFAVFTGAIGVGIGFGLQAVISNLIAGLIILLDRSLKVGDFVDLESGVTGEVREINVRNTVITTNDNIDVLVPNSQFVNGRVTNWTYRDVYRRMRVPFGVAYGTDKERVRAAGLEAAASVKYTLTGHRGRDPDVWLVGFGDSSLNFELVVWLTPDATKRPGAVHAAYCWALETALGKYGIEIPFPQRDVHFRSPVSIVTGAPAAADDPSGNDTDSPSGDGEPSSPPRP
jgi:potassium efflux system protein